MALTPFESLNPTEREELTLCGISSEEQLVKSSADTLIKDLRQARAIFPDKTFTLTDEKIRTLFPQSESVQRSEDSELPDWNRVEPVVTFRRGSHKRSGDTKQKYAHILHSPVRCTHPGKAILAALATLLLLVPAMGTIAFAWLMVTDNLPGVAPWIPVAAVFALPVAFYLIMARCATCPVCHMRIFRFTHYPRNRAAHHLPLLGYNLATALHLLFLWSYNCPGCGTPIKLLGTKGHRTHC